MKIRIYFTTLFLVFSSMKGTAQNQFVGTWVMDSISTFYKRQSLMNSETENFSSSIQFKSDSTFIKITSGINVLTGRYYSTENKLIMETLNKDGKWEQYWLMRWPHGENDPFPQTKGIDFVFPELMQVNDKKRGKVVGEVNVYYKKIN